MKAFLGRIIACLFVICVLVACNPAPTATSTPLATEPPPTMEPSLTATLTLAPPQTSTPIITQPPPSATPFPTELVDNIPTKWAPFRACVGKGFLDNEHLLSPKKNWYLCTYGDFNNFALVHQDGTLWEISAKEQFGFDYYGVIHLVRWTPDEQFLYISAKRYRGDGPNLLNINAEALFRLELPTRKVRRIIGNVAKLQNPLDWDVYAVSISPTNRRLAYSQYPLGADTVRPDLHIVDLQTGQEDVIEIEPEYRAIGGFKWSDDGQLLVYKLHTPETSEPGGCTREYSMRLLDLKGLSSNTFVKNLSVEYCVSGFPEFETINVLDEQIVLERNDGIWIYHINTQRLELRSTATPSP